MGPGERESKFISSKLLSESFLLVYFTIIISVNSLLWSSVADAILVSGSLWPWCFRILLTHTFIIRMATFLLSADNRQPETPPVPWLTMDTANRCQKRKPTVHLYSWLHSKAIQRRQSHRSWDLCEKNYILLTYPRMKQNKQSRTVQLE